MRTSASTRVFAVLGSPVAHSLSPAMHNHAFRALGLDAVYVALECQADEVGAVMRALARGGGGGNVTVPHKAHAFAALDRPTSVAREAAVANTFWFEDGQLAGDNTDVAGILAALARIGAPADAWLVAGTGGAARAVVQAARRCGARLAVHSRDASRARDFSAWAEASGVTGADTAEATVLINATPLGLHPTDALPFAKTPGNRGPRATHALDLVYAPGGTPWIRALRAERLIAADGREMLLAQGAAAFERWFPGRHAPVEVMRAAIAGALG
ncbi:MAG: shikimate dehydrogenase family protein [Gemmatimonadales bacterium]